MPEIYLSLRAAAVRRAERTSDPRLRVGFASLMGWRETRTRVIRAAGIAALAAAALAASGCSGNSGEDDADVVAGKQLFVSKCGACHTLARAGTKGTVGPNLDDAFAVSRKEKWGDGGIRGAVHEQILHPGIGGVMPAKIVTGQQAKNVAAYVALVAARTGKDTGLLATAVKAAGGGAPAVAKNGVLSIAADPGGQLKYVTDVAKAPAGPIQVQMPNTSGVTHDLVIEGTNIKTPEISKGIAKASGVLKPGVYTYFCSVPGHRQAGMQGKLTVK
jgi:mono/diheme cytochrome c family protein